MPDANNAQYDGLTGYRLQTKRLGHTGKSGIRTFKLPLKTDDQELFNTFFNDIRHDHERQLGATNITSWLDQEREDLDCYNLLEFWLDSLRAGIVFAPKASALNQLLASISGTSVDDKVKKDLRSVNPEFLDALDWEAFREEIALKGAKRATATPDSFRRDLIGCLEDSEEDTPDGVIADIEQTVERFFTDNGDTISGEKQNQYWRDNFGLDKSLYDLGGDMALTFYPVPNINHTPEADAQAILQKYREWVSDNADVFNLDDPEAKREFLRRRLGNLQASGNYNAFSNYFNEVINTLEDEGGVEQLKETLLAVGDMWSDNKAELELRLNFLQERARRLGQPKCAGSWAHYRSVLGGRLASWLSNTFRQEQFIAETTEKQKEEVAALQDIYKNGVFSDVFSADDDDRDEQLASHLRTAKDLLNDLRDQYGFDPEVLQVYRDTLGRLCSLLNRASQIAEDQDFTVDSYPALYEDVRLIPKFVGAAKRERFQKYRHSLTILKEGIDYLQSVSVDINAGDSDVSEDYFLRQLNALKRFYNQANSQRFRHIVAELFAQVGVEAEALGENDTFYISPYSNSTRGRNLIEIENTPDNPATTLKQWADKTAPYWEDILQTQNWGELMDATRLARIRWGWITELAGDSLSVDLSEDLDESFSQTPVFRDLHGEAISGQTAGGFLQRVILSEMSGRIKEASREQFTVRYVVQPMKTNERYPLWVTADGDEITAQSRDQWYVRHFEQDFSNDESDTAGWTIGGKGKKPQEGFAQVFVPDEADVFAIKTSKYQLHFLDNALPEGAKRFRDDGCFSISFSEHSFIAEETIAADWDFEKDRVVLESVGQDIYAALPVQIEPDEERSAHDDRTRYLGIDVGEYGLAYTLLDTKPKLEVLQTGFVYEPTLLNIRKQMTNIKESQRKGTFGIPSTKLARIRSQAVTKLRSRIHDLVVRYDAKPVYEWQIQHFETGSGRVTKIYNSVKRADVSVTVQDDADSAEAELVWGNNTWRVGTDINAYATSNMCSNCYRSIYGYDSPRFEFMTKTGDYARFQVEDGASAWAYLLSQSPKTAGNDEIIRGIKDFSRPGIDVAAGRDMNDFSFDQEQTQQLIGKRGNSCLFTCPFCNHVSDADVQASLFIALRGLLRDRQDDKESSIGVSELLTFAKNEDLQAGASINSPK